MLCTRALRSPHTVVLLVNLGSPASLSRRGIRDFLRLFLSDTRVISLTQYVWLPILYAIILPFRPAALLHKYKCVWRHDGDDGPGMSYLTWYSTSLAHKLDAHFADLHKSDNQRVKVELAMRYGEPNIASVLARLDTTVGDDKSVGGCNTSDTCKTDDCSNSNSSSSNREAALGAVTQAHTSAPRRVLVLPLFPQYSSTTTASIFDAVSAYYASSARRRLPSLHFVRDYADHPAYIHAVASSVVQAMCTHYHVANAPRELGRALATRKGSVALVFSYHSIPVQYAKEGDDYAQRCRATTNAVSRVLEEQLGMPMNEFVLHVYQSRFGNLPWLEPFLTDAVQTLPLQPSTAHAKAAKSAFAAKAGKPYFQGACIDTCFVVAPGFAVDCLETLHEIREEAHELFVKSGGRTLVYIDALNDTHEHVSALANVVQSIVPV